MDIQSGVRLSKPDIPWRVFPTAAGPQLRATRSSTFPIYAGRVNNVRDAQQLDFHIPREQVTRMKKSKGTVPYWPNLGESVSDMSAQKNPLDGRISKVREKILLECKSIELN